MIHHIPSPRLEPPHEDCFSDEPEPITDYDLEVQEEEYLWSCGLTDEQLNTIYKRLGL